MLRLLIPAIYLLSLATPAPVASQRPAAYFVNPVTGDDANTGTTPSAAWRTLPRLNRQPLGPGDRVSIAQGVLYGTLAPTANGTKDKPVEIRFSAGRHELQAEGAKKLCYFVSNSADAPYEPRPVGILCKNVKHLRVVGEPNSEIVFGDRMTEIINDHSEDVTYTGLKIDMARPTVSEFRVMNATEASAEIQVAEGSTFAIQEGRFAWTGDLGPGWTMVQEAIPAEGKCWRRGQWDLFSLATATRLGGNRVRLDFPKGNPGLIKDHQFQFRNVERDTVSGLNTRSKDIAFRLCDFYALPGMAIVSQFTENVTFQHVSVIPRPGTLRTCPAWADCFHFSGCRGKVTIEACMFSGTQDDPVNVHGTHLRLIEKVDSKHVLVRFMHPQTYGFAAFQPEDRVKLVSHVNLRPYASAKVTSIKRKSDTDWLLGLDREVPSFAKNDVIDNVSWYPDLQIQNCYVTMDSCRGFLISTRGKVVVSNNYFANTAMSAILIADDANSWFESGEVKDVAIRQNFFANCGEPTISIHPENQTTKLNEPVHENIRIEQNLFQTGGISARSVKGLTVAENLFRSPGPPIRIDSCSSVQAKQNQTGIPKKP